MFEDDYSPPRKRHTGAASYGTAYGANYGASYGTGYVASYATRDENHMWQPTSRGDARGAQVKIYQDSLGSVTTGSVPPGMRPLRGVPIRLNYTIPFPHAQVSDGPQVSHNQVPAFGTTLFGSGSGVNPWSESAPFPNTGDFDRSKGAEGQGSFVQVSDPRSRLRDPFYNVPASPASESPALLSPPVRVSLLGNYTNPNLALTPVQPTSSDEEDAEVAEAVDEVQPLWQDHIDRWFQNLAASTRKRYRVIINNFIQYLLEYEFQDRSQDLRDVNNVTLAHMQRWIASFGDRRSGTNSNSTKRKHAVCIKSFWKSLFYHWQETGVTRNAADGLKIPPRDRRLRVNKYMSAEDVQKFLVEARRKSCTHTCLLGLMYYAGLRVAEVCELKHDDIEFITENEKTSMIVRVRGDAAKGCRYREIKCNREEAITYLYDQLEHLKGLSPNDFYFPGDSRDPDTRERKGNRGVEGVYRIVKKFGKMPSINMPRVTPHWFRHAFATHARDRGKSTQSISRALGHSSVKTTEIYLQDPTGAAED